ncbi:EF-hand domain-containing protein [Noviherbaspirillum saxi]|uniref:EF-hand domain-containing protein n=1 Tax=Noviherbaspirillum saxi TaxID=2320863 RepID=A0A3A3G9R7_9BURK|nr:EF-hand domain-containing protein [Noviherbaspirillum saxi]RJF97609.1 EF-hand domain-containing protein [Noviherbaspirillum saxi]
MQHILACMVAGTVFGAGLAIATEPAPAPVSESKPKRHLAKFDEQFKTADIDQDGALSKAEAQNANMDRVVSSFDRLDLNKDGKVTREEIRLLLRSRLSS